MAAKNGTTETPATPAKKERKKKTPVDPNETKAARFARLGNIRTRNAIKALSNVGKLTGSNYESTPEQVQKILSALTSALSQAKHRLENGGTADSGGFSL